MTNSTKHNIQEHVKELQDNGFDVPGYLYELSIQENLTLLKGRHKGAMRGVDFCLDPTNPPGRKHGARKGVDLSYKPSKWLQKAEPIIRLRIQDNLKLEVISIRLGFTKQHISKTIKDFNEFLATLSS